MKTNQKKEYVAPRLDVILVELEEGIAQTSGASGVSGVRGWEDGNGAVSNGPEEGAF